MTASRADFIWIALGAPRQEELCARLQGTANGLMIGIGGALNILAGIIPEAPAWMRNLSLEWLYRLIQEPKRLFRRYLVTNTKFVLFAVLQEWIGWRPEPMQDFIDKTLMITGGTGSFGSTVLRHFLGSGIGEIRIFSRDEKKQDDLRHELQTRDREYSQRVRFFIGDVRSERSVRDAMHGVDAMFSMRPR